MKVAPTHLPWTANLEFRSSLSQTGSHATDAVFLELYVCISTIDNRRSILFSAKRNEVIVRTW